MSESIDKQAALTTAYQEVCRSYHAIADFRAKLLGLLPLASGAGIFLLLNDAFFDPAKGGALEQFLLPVGVFGVVVTFGLFCYELRGIQRCNGLIAVGQKLEAALGLAGQFALRPPDVGGFIGSTLAARIIYPMVLAAWTFISLVFAWPEKAMLIASLVFAAGFVGSYALNLKAPLEGEPNRGKD